MNHVENGERLVDSDYKETDVDDGLRRKRKKKKKRRHRSSENLNGFDEDQVDSDRENKFLLRTLESQDKGVAPGEKDLRKVALHLARSKSKDGEKYLHYDYVLTHKTGDNHNVHEKLRDKFEGELLQQGFKVERRCTIERTFVILHCTFRRLGEEAEHVCLEMPLAGVS